MLSRLSQDALFLLKIHVDQVMSDHNQKIIRASIDTQYVI